MTAQERSLGEWALAMLGIDPRGLGGVCLAGPSSPAADNWLTGLRQLLDRLPGRPAGRGVPWRRMPAHIDSQGLLGGLDFAASLAQGRPVLASGLLPSAHGGAVLVPMAERLEPGTAALLAQVLDRGEVELQREGLSRILPAQFLLLAQDESRPDELPFSAVLRDRLAFQLFSEDAESLHLAKDPWPLDRLAAARRRLGQVRLCDEDRSLLVEAALACGISSLRAVLLGQATARCSAALRGNDSVDRQDLERAIQLVLFPRAELMPGSEAEQPQQAEPQRQDDAPENPSSQANQLEDEQLVAVAQANLPPGLLTRLQVAALRQRALRGGGKSGAAFAGKLRGRPIGARPGLPRDAQRLHLSATLKAAAPWQKLRRTSKPSESVPGRNPKLQLRASDLHIQRRKSRTETTTVFVVDASGSSAAQRLAEAKGAVELLLSECYVRRDQVALIAFRGTEAELLLPPTRALARARRELAGLPGGGGTPLAAGLDAARLLCSDLQKRGRKPVIVLMTDGRANVSMDGSPGHDQAQQEAQLAARQLRSAGWSSILIDTSPRPRPKARELAEAMAAEYLPLPYGDEGSLGNAVRQTAAASH